jgi:hypothetical protein
MDGEEQADTCWWAGLTTDRSSALHVIHVKGREGEKLIISCCYYWWRAGCFCLLNWLSRARTNHIDKGNIYEKERKEIEFTMETLAILFKDYNVIHGESMIWIKIGLNKDLDKDYWKGFWLNKCLGIWPIKKLGLNMTFDRWHGMHQLDGWSRAYWFECWPCWHKSNENHKRSSQIERQMYATASRAWLVQQHPRRQSLCSCWYFLTSLKLGCHPHHDARNVVLNKCKCSSRNKYEIRKRTDRPVSIILRALGQVRY